MVVRLRYTLKAADGRVLARSADEGDLYRHGGGANVPGLERALEGKHAGDKLSITVSPADGYGPRGKSPGPQPVPRATFPEDAALVAGVSFEAETPDGKPVTLFVTRVEESAVYVDSNHPFAGMTLHYDVEVMSVRRASEEELAGAPLS